MKIVFDLDGVLRDLMSYLCMKFNFSYPDNWFWEHEGKDIFKWIEDDHYRCLVYAPITEYLLPILKTKYPIELWTCQPDTWKPYTELWIWRNIPNCQIRYLNTKQKEARLYREKDTYLIEDCPNFKNYDRIILIDRPYNRNIKAPVRVKYQEDLIALIKRSEHA